MPTGHPKPEYTNTGFAFTAEGNATCARPKTPPSISSMYAMVLYPYTAQTFKTHLTFPLGIETKTDPVRDHDNLKTCRKTSSFKTCFCI